MESTVVIPVHNRRETTLQCLRNLQADAVLEWAEIIVVDDGSTDGTAKSVRDAFPQARLLEGNGSLWWAGAIQIGMDHASEASQTLIWLNDDCRPLPGVLRKMHDFARENGHVAVARAVTPHGFTYGGWMKTRRGLRPAKHQPNASYRVDSFGGNCVAIPRNIVRSVGSLDAIKLFHNHADADYALRIRAAGFRSFVVKGAKCESDHNENPLLGSWSESSLSFRELLVGMRSPKSMFFWPSRKHFYVKHWGLPWGLVLACLPYVRFALMASFAKICGRSRLIALRNLFRKSFKFSKAP